MSKFETGFPFVCRLSIVLSPPTFFPSSLPLACLPARPLAVPSPPSLLPSLLPFVLLPSFLSFVLPWLLPWFLPYIFLLSFLPSFLFCFRPSFLPFVRSSFHSYFRLFFFLLCFFPPVSPCCLPFFLHSFLPSFLLLPSLLHAFRLLIDFANTVLPSICRFVRSVSASPPRMNTRVPARVPDGEGGGACLL